jgi:hypothetical protein
MPIPTPEPGLVISYAYLWHIEHEAGERVLDGFIKRASLTDDMLNAAKESKSKLIFCS